MADLDQRDPRQLCGLLTDPAFAVLARDAVLDYVDWNELLQRPLPAGLSAEDTWRLLTEVRRFGRTVFPIRDLRDREYWYTLTREARVCVDAIERYCRADSTVHRAIVHRHGRRLLVDSQVLEAIAACRLDGVVLDASEAEQMLRSGRMPRTDAERLVSNLFSLFSEIDETSPQPFSPDGLHRLYERLTAGVDTDALERITSRRLFAERTETEPVTREISARVLEQYCAYANGESGDPAEPVAAKAHSLLNTTSYWQFFPDFNGIMGRLVYRLYASLCEYPVLGMLPIASLYEAWLNGRLVTSLMRFQSVDLRRTIGETEVDYTPDVLIILQLSLVGLDQTLSAIERGREKDAEIRVALEHDPEINYRQRSIIARALAAPHTEFRIRQHQTAHNVVYATARTDLLDLAERGYLVQEARGRAFVFVPASDLAVRLARAEHVEITDTAED